MKTEGEPEATSSDRIEGPIRFRSVVDEYVWELASNGGMDGARYDLESRCRYFLVRGQLVANCNFVGANGDSLSIAGQNLLRDCAGAILCLKDDGVLEVEYYGKSEQQLLENVWSDLTADIAAYNERC